MHALRAYTVCAVAAWLVWAGLAPAAPAQRSGQMPSVFDGVGMEEQLGAYVPADLVFVDESGQEVALRTYLDRGKPVLLNLVYHNCPMLCNLLLDGFTETLQALTWTPGEAFEIVTVSFAPDEGPDLAARQKERYMKQLGKPAAAEGWHFLTGSEASIQALAGAVGFQFRWVEAQQEYAHPAAHIFLSASGRITRYLYGLQPSPRDVRMALVEAGEGKVGTTLDQVVLYCFQYDPQAGSYVPYAVNIMKLGGLLTMLALGGMLFIFWRREHTRLQEALAEAGDA